MSVMRFETSDLAAAQRGVEGQDRRVSVTGGRRSPWLVTIAVVPLVAVVTRSLADQQSDNLVPAVYSAEHPFDLYLPRIVPLIQFLTFPITDYSANLRVQVLLRVLAFCVVVVWIALRVADFLRGSRAVAVMAAAVLAVYFFIRYPEAGDSIYYGVSAGMTSTAVYLLAIASGHRAVRAATLRAGVIWGLVSFGLACAASFYYVTLLLWAWLLLILDIGSRDRIALVGQLGERLPWFHQMRVHASVLLCAGIAAIAYLRAGSGENTGLSVGRSIEVVLKTRYLWDRSNLYILENLVLVAVLAGAVFLIARSMRAFILGCIGALSAVGVFAIASLDHVADNVHLPRYYAPSLFIGLMVVFTALAVAVANRANLTRAPAKEALVNGRTVKSGAQSSVGRRWTLVVCAIGIVGLLVFIKTPIGFGFEGSDGQQIRKQGFPLGVRDVKSLESELGVDLTFVTGSHWQVWATVFAAHEDGEDLFPVAPFTRAFARSDKFIPRVPTYGVCLDLSDGQCAEVAQSLAPPESGWVFTVESATRASNGRLLHIMKLDRT